MKKIIKLIKRLFRKSSSEQIKDMIKSNEGNK